MRQTCTSWKSRGWVAVASMGLLSGCVATFYQPLTSLQKPVLVDMQAPNFQGRNMLIRCYKNEHFDAGSASKVCKNVRTLFVNQGAQVLTQTPEEGRAVAFPENEKTPDLVVDIRSRKTRVENSPAALTVLHGLTFTLVPVFTESQFTQDVIIRDGTGFILTQDTLSARIVEYSGVLVGGLKSLEGAIQKNDPNQAELQKYSTDFYGQLSQLAFHAHMRARAMSGFLPLEDRPADSEK